MLRKIIASVALSANLAVLTNLNGALASQEFATEIPRAAVSKPVTGGVSVDSQLAPRLNHSLIQFEKFGLYCQSNSKSQIPSLVSEVASDSIAYRKGLKAGDKIVALKGSAEANSLTIDRAGKFYAVSLSAFDLNPRSGTLASITAPALSAGARESDAVLPVGPFYSAILSERHNGVVQGPMGNCWFEASLSAVADSPQGPQLLSQMITSSGPGYAVKFPNFPVVTVTDAQIANARLVDPGEWAKILEMAEMEVDPDNAPSRGAMIGNPGVKVGLELLTGKPVTFVRPDSMSESDLSNLLDRLHSQSLPVTMASKSPAEHRQPIQPVVPNHAYSLVDFDKASHLITLRNPLGTPGPSGQDGLVRRAAYDEIQIDLSTFATFFRFVAYPN